MCDIEKEKLIPKGWAGQVEEESKPREDLVVDTEQKKAVLSIGQALGEEFKKGRGLVAFVIPNIGEMGAPYWRHGPVKKLTKSQTKKQPNRHNPR